MRRIRRRLTGIVWLGALLAAFFAASGGGIAEAQGKEDPELRALEMEEELLRSQLEVYLNEVAKWDAKSGRVVFTRKVELGGLEGPVQMLLSNAVETDAAGRLRVKEGVKLRPIMKAVQDFVAAGGMEDVEKLRRYQEDGGDNPFGEGIPPRVMKLVTDLGSALMQQDLLGGSASKPKLGGDGRKGKDDDDDGDEDDDEKGDKDEDDDGDDDDKRQPRRREGGARRERVERRIQELEKELRELEKMLEGRGGGRGEDEDEGEEKDEDDGERKERRRMRLFRFEVPEGREFGFTPEDLEKLRKEFEGFGGPDMERQFGELFRSGDMNELRERVAKAIEEALEGEELQKRFSDMQKRALEFLASPEGQEMQRRIAEFWTSKDAEAMRQRIEEFFRSEQGQDLAERLGEAYKRLQERFEGGAEKEKKSDKEKKTDKKVESEKKVEKVVKERKPDEKKTDKKRDPKRDKPVLF